MPLVNCSFCGNQLNRPPSRLKKTKDNFCSQECHFKFGMTEEQKRLLRKRPYEWTYNRLLKAAKYRDLQVTLSFEDFLELVIITSCHYCETNIPWQKHATRERCGGYYFLDRKNNDKGYTNENCVVCCPRCNWAKGDIFTYEEWFKIGAVIRSWNGS